MSVDVPAKYTERFYANGGALLNELYQEFVELRIIMPRAAPAAAGDSASVIANLRGPKECVEQCRQRILQFVSEWVRVLQFPLHYTLPISTRTIQLNLVNCTGYTYRIHSCAKYVILTMLSLSLSLSHAQNQNCLFV